MGWSSLGLTQPYPYTCIPPSVLATFTSVRQPCGHMSAGHATFSGIHVDGKALGDALWKEVERGSTESTKHPFE